MKANGARAFALLEKIGFERVSGSDEELRAAHILLDELKDAGVEGKLESFDVADGDVLRAELTVLEPYVKTYQVAGYKCAGSTPAEGLTAPLLYVGDVTDVSLADAKDKIILINGRMTIDNYIKVRRSGATGFITMTGTLLDPADARDVDTRKIRPNLAQYGLTPGLNMHIVDAMEMVKLGASKVKMELANQDTTLVSHNVVAEIPGTAHPEEIVAIGAHFDSVQFSSGVYDNGAGSVIIMELLRHFKANPPARTLRFIWFGSEEQGLLGSKAYLAAHEDEVEKHIFMINVDVGAIVLGHDVASVSADKDLTTFIAYLSKETGFPIDVRYDIMSSDSSSFVDKGIPALSFGRGGTRGAEFMHTRYDCIDFQSAQVLENSASFTGTAVERLVNAVVFPVPRTIPDEIKQKTDKYFHKEPVKL